MPPAPLIATKLNIPPAHTDVIRLPQLFALLEQGLRGLLFALVLFPLRKRFMDLGVWGGGLVFGSIIFVVGFVAASGGMVEHFVWFTEYPARFAMITFIEILVQVAIMGPWTVKWMKQAALDKELPASLASGAVQATYGSK